MTKYNQITVAPNDIANSLNALKADGKDVCYVVPCHTYDGTIVVIVYKELSND